MIISKVFWIMLTFSGYTMTLDATELYGIGNMRACQQTLSKIVAEYKAIHGLCYKNKMIKYFKDANLRKD